MKEGLKEMKNERMQVKSSSGRDMKKIKKANDLSKQQSNAISVQSI